jgi:16S rRNA (guanine1207-N2)-methyltransferase
VTQYFDEQPSVASRPGRVRLRVPGVDAELSVDRGVFSAGGIDPGTIELLRTDSEAPLAGDVLDLGCGYGPIAAALALRHPAAVVWAVDVNARARELAAANATELGLGGRLHVAAPDGVPGEVRFTAIWSNPPIRIGKAALHDLLSTWLPRLTEAGQARMVVHKHLGSDSLAAWLSGEGWAVRRLGSRKGYRILEVTRPL